MRAWDDFLALQEVGLGVETVHKWLKTLKVVRYDACNLYLEAKDSFQVMWFEEHIRQEVQSKLVNNNQKKIKVHLAVANSPSKAKQTKRQDKNEKSSAATFILNFDELDPSCTFDHYVSSEKNALAEKLLKSIQGLTADQPGELGIFNPIYLHGSPGTGKTHLLMATAHALKEKGLKVLYSKTETFTEHVVSAIRSGEMSIFRQSYRNSDVLILDDVQVLSKKAATQEELFHTFNTLHLANKQIILSANCSPGELQHIEPRLISRFEWGVVLNLFPLSRDELAKVLLQKAKLLNFSIHDKVLDFLLDHFTSGSKALVRSLEALVLRSHLNNPMTRHTVNSMTIPMVKQILHDLLLEEKQHVLTAEKAIQMIAEVFGIKAEDVMGKAQTRDCVFPRQLAMYTCRHKLKMPFTKIGDLFSKDHSTVMTSVKAIQNKIDSNDEETLSAYHSLQKKLEQL